MPGAFSRFHELVKLGLFKFSSKFVLSVYDSFSNSPWNGGRITMLGKMVTPERCKQLVKLYNNKGIGVFVTFSNYRIDNPFSIEENDFLRLLNQSALNGVILVNNNIRQHICSHYPNVKISYSVSGFDSLRLDGVSSIFNQCDFVCPRYEWVFDPKFYSTFNITKCNVMLNDCCKSGCSLWKEHFKAISDANRLNETDPKKLKSIQECWIASHKNNPSDGWGCNGDVGMNLDKDGIKRLINIGYQGFKICGRDLPEDEFYDEVSSYLEMLCSLR